MQENRIKRYTTNDFSATITTTITVARANNIIKCWRIDRQFIYYVLCIQCS